MRNNDILKICDAAPSLTILCIGDLMQDRFVYGKVSRISPEAPIPVLKQSNAISMLGAVGNVARNVASLGAGSILLSVVGEDAAGRELQERINSERGISGNAVVEAGRSTTTKVRYIANGQQLLRVDEEDTHSVSENAEYQLIEKLEGAAAQCQAILLSDYAKGCVSNRVIEACVSLSKQHAIPLIVDPKGTDFAKYGAVDLVKPNASELSDATGLPTATDEDVEAALKALIGKIDASAVLVTRSEKGLSYMERGQPVRHIRTVSREVFDVSGAGDTSLASLGIALATGAGLEIASEFALSAAGIAVGKIGTAAVSLDEVRADISNRFFKRADLSNAAEIDTFAKIEDWRRAGLKIGFTNGCFDILHAGHLSALDFAASHCDRLIVGLNSDASVKRLKGESRPVNSEQDRQTLLYGLKPVDAVLLFEEDTPQNLIERIQPDVLVKGGDYTPETVVGADIVRARGGKVIIAPLLEGRSTTNIIAKSRN